MNVHRSGLPGGALCHIPVLNHAGAIADPGRRTENRNSCGYACACARRSSPCAHHTIRLPRPPAARRRRALSMPPLPRPPQPRHRMVLAAIAVIAVIAVIAAAPYGLGGYCRIGLSAIAYERTIMPSRRTRRRRGHHHPTRHARWRRSIVQPPGQAPGPVTRPTKLLTKLRGGHRPSTRA